MTTHYNILAWSIPWTEQPGGLQSMGLKGWAWLSTHAQPWYWNFHGFDKCKTTCVHFYSIIQNNFTALKTSKQTKTKQQQQQQQQKNPLLFTQSSFLPIPIFGNNYIFSCLHHLPFPNWHIPGIIQYIAFLDWLISLSYIN